MEVCKPFFQVVLKQLEQNLCAHLKAIGISFSHQPCFIFKAIANFINTQATAACCLKEYLQLRFISVDMQLLAKINVIKAPCFAYILKS